MRASEAMRAIREVAATTTHRRQTVERGSPRHAFRTAARAARLRLQWPRRTPRAPHSPALSDEGARQLDGEALASSRTRRSPALGRGARQLSDAAFATCGRNV